MNHLALHNAGGGDIRDRIDGQYVLQSRPVRSDTVNILKEILAEDTLFVPDGHEDEFIIDLCIEPILKFLEEIQILIIYRKKVLYIKIKAESRQWNETEGGQRQDDD